MSNIFTCNPIRINVFSFYKKKITDTFVILSNLEEKITKELENIIKGRQYNETKLKNFYGPLWKRKLGLILASSKKVQKNIKGGFDLADLSFSNLSNENNEDENFLKKSDNINIENLVTKSIFQGSPLKTKIKPLYIKEGDRNLFFIMKNFFIFPEDGIYELKEKIYYLTGIPLYKQHTWLNYHKKHILISYKLLEKNTSQISISLSDLYNENIKKIFDIPVLINYINKDIYVISNEYNRLVRHYYNKYGEYSFNVMNLQEILNKNQNQLKKIFDINKHQFNMIYYGFVKLFFPGTTKKLFLNIIRDSTKIRINYPDLEKSFMDLSKIYKNENQILMQKNILFSEKKYSKILTNLMKITKMNMVRNLLLNIEYKMTESHIVSLRNLFDNLITNKIIPIIQTKLYHDSQFIKLTKLHKMHKLHDLYSDFKENISLMILINPTEKSLYKKILIRIFPNGNYSADIRWKTNIGKNITPKDIFSNTNKIINPLINNINNLPKYVFYSQDKFKEINKYNYNIAESDFKFFYNKILTNKEFNLFKKLINKYVEAGIFIKRYEETNSIFLCFKKGFHQPNINIIKKFMKTHRQRNYYVYLSELLYINSWKQFTIKSIKIDIIHRITDVVISVEKIGDKEFDILENIIFTLLYEFTLLNKSKLSNNDQNKLIIKKFGSKSLKEKDPILYNFKNYNTDLIYSKICQKKFQPTLMDKQEFKNYIKKTKGKKLNNYVKYWNFTTNTNTYYVCNKTKNYPYVKFITGKHPKNYCLPCCKKIMPLRNETYKDIYKICTTKFSYDKTKKINKYINYIVKYGKILNENRISYLPKNLNFIFEEKTINNISYEYYMLGVSQRTKNIENIGIIFCLSNILNITYEQLILDIINKLKKNKNIYDIIIGMKNKQLFKNINNFIDVLRNIFLSQGLLSFDYKDYINFKFWNNIIKEFFILFYNIQVVLFDESDNSLIIKTKDDKDIMKKFALYDNYIFIISRKNKYYPIFKLNKNIFFKTHNIEQKIFNKNKDKDLLDKVNLLHFILKNKIIKIKKNVDSVHLDEIFNFLNKSKIYNFYKLLVNNSNYCYAMLIQKNNNKNYIYFPFSYTRYKYYSSYSSITNFIYTSPCTKKDIEEFIAKYNNFSKNKIIITHNLILKTNNKKLIGYQLNNNLFCYFKHILLQSLNSNVLNNNKNLYLLYDPSCINKILVSKHTIAKDCRTENISKDIYMAYLYDIFISELNNYFNSEKNIDIRKIIKKNITITNFKDPFQYSNFIKELNKLNLNINDKNKIIDIIRTNMIYKNVKMISRILDKINNNSFIFDKMSYNRLKKIKNEQILIKELLKISKKITKIVSKIIFKKGNYINDIVNCTEKINTFYCKNQKLIICQIYLDKIINQLVKDMLNPLKKKWIFNPLFINRNIDFFKFKKNVNEKVIIELL